MCKLTATVLQRVARGSGTWTELTLDGLNKLMLLVEERLFPGEELAAAMASTAVVGGGNGDVAGAPGFASAGAAAGERAGSERGSPVCEAGGGLGEDGAAARALSHLVECILEVNLDVSSGGSCVCCICCILSVGTARG